MNIHSIPYNVDYTFDENLREVPDNADEMAAAVDYLNKVLIQEQDPRESLSILGLLGGLCRILGQLEEAEAHISNALAVANSLRDNRARVVNLIRLAHIYQWGGDTVGAEKLLNQVIIACGRRKALAKYIDFAYQHLGKSKFDQGDYEAAADLFQRALTIRENKDDKHLIASTEYAIAVTIRRMRAQNSG